MGMAWGVQHKKLGEEKGRICRGNPCFSGFFSYNAHDSDAPEGGENERIGGGFAWGCAQKKSPGNEFLDPFCGCYLSENMFKIGMTRTKGKL